MHAPLRPTKSPALIPPSLRAMARRVRNALRRFCGHIQPKSCAERLTRGRSTRSEKGWASSSSWSVIGWALPPARYMSSRSRMLVSPRASTRPPMRSIMLSAASALAKMVTISISNLDINDALDQDETEYRGNGRSERDAQRPAGLEQPQHVLRIDREDDQRQRQRQQPDHIT